MKKDSYPFLSKLLHDFYLGNYFISETSYEIEKKIFRNAINSFELNEQVFITGLARAGTTALFNKLYGRSLMETKNQNWLKEPIMTESKLALKALRNLTNTFGRLP